MDITTLFSSLNITNELKIDDVIYAKLYGNYHYIIILDKDNNNYGINILYDQNDYTIKYSELEDISLTNIDKNTFYYLHND